MRIATLVLVRRRPRAAGYASRLAKVCRDFPRGFYEVRYAHYVPSDVEKVVAACRQFALALITADEGELYVVSASPAEVHLHLAGTCAGCPGAPMTEASLLRPIVLESLPDANLRVTTGWRVPSGAMRVA